MVNSRRFRNIVVLIIIVFLCLIVVTISLRESEFTESIKAKTLDIFKPVQEEISSLFNPVTRFFTSIEDYIGLRQKYLELEEENAWLRSHYAEDISIKVENDALRKLLEIDIRKDHDIFIVKVIGFYSNRWQSEIILSAGTSDGVREGMGVVGSNGLAGIIISAGNNSSRARLISDPQSSLGTRILSSRKLGLNEGSQEGIVYLKYIPADEEIYKGDIIVTSEYGRYLPPDILIGRVSSVLDIAGDPYREIIIEPFEDFRNLEYLMVIR
ncbi:MAG: rod shape-determining protein MreC [Actinomycetia bacterium]|nr:rod shape-determining protein MreC [Actinomycetes bacterium]